MPIPVQTIVSRLQAALDSEGNDRYTFEQDFKYAINQSIEWLVTACNSAFAKNKAIPEALRELTKSGVWQANKFSKINFNSTDTGRDLWTILRVDPKPQIYPVTILVPNTDPLTSSFYPAISFVKSDQSCDRLTAEQWNKNVKNIFVPGNEVMTGELQAFGYTDFVNGEIEVRPSVANQYVGMLYLAHPVEITAIDDDIEFPLPMANLITEKALNFISYKQGDGTNAYEVTERDVQRLISFLS